MKTDPGLQTTHDIRERISRAHGNDPRRLVEYFMELQRRFAGRPPPAAKAGGSRRTSRRSGPAFGRPLIGKAFGKSSDLR